MAQSELIKQFGRDYFDLPPKEKIEKWYGNVDMRPEVSSFHLTVLEEL